MPFEIRREDITRMRVHAMVSAASPGDAEEALFRAAGPGLLRECRLQGACRVGEAKMTGGYGLPARYVIHTAGPVWEGGMKGEDEKLRACYLNALHLARDSECESIAFPLISADACGYPGDRAMKVAVEAIRSFLLSTDMTVFLVLRGEDACSVRERLREVEAYIAASCAEDSFISDSRIYVTEAVHLCMSIPQDGGEPDWETLFRERDEGFSGALIRLIDEKGLTDPECYRRANIDRKLFSKIRSNPAYHPRKAIVYAFAVALRLDLVETEELLRTAGLAMTRSDRMDIVMEYFISNGLYDIYEINEVLFRFDLSTLGSGVR